MIEIEEKIASMTSIVSNLKSANNLISKELDKLLLQLAELQIAKSDLEPTVIKKDSAEQKQPKTNVVVRRSDDNSEPASQNVEKKYDIHVVGLGTVKIDY